MRFKKGEVFNLEKLVKIGLPLSAGENLAKHLGIEPKDFFKRFLGMSDSTVRRWFKRDQLLSTRESDRVVRYAHLLSLATNLMSGSEEDARTWLSSSVYALGTSTPLETAVTETGARRVEDLIVALERGIFS
ncbi:antitoxin Xre/MbcA/ParS toxin-binding domain-containing protein [Chromatocurvus halotolerans]|uniref:Putative toxin-antitoxin system antitoxin component (TIGR02293 family) n=1 Tax=Chromatocurvus halotolerans TaxID=1132028 RepID=A0A4R2KVS5_9GAMM|nr:antitoxin Xre/MbcA/ParS toxin-binding domain-containing protein [Chromatocurvus halotolerans]TCO78611.1 putative toxin-antitoxin system antitoxin component (TIGR02293 family) [Chromatocurvus halotolerans]